MFCWQHFQVRAYPAVIIYDEKGNQATRFDGLYPQETIDKILE
jgi:thioredoxin-related protein